MKALIPAAGRGTRFLPWTTNNPKELLPVLDPETGNIRAVIDLVLEEAVGAGSEDILIIGSIAKTALEGHIGSLRANGYLDLSRILFAHQRAPNGLGDAIKYGKGFINPQELFLLLLGDDFYDPNPSRILVDTALKMWPKLNGSLGGLLMVQEAPLQELARYGVVSIYPGQTGRVFRLDNLIEKPQGTPPSNLFITGRYVLSASIIYDYLPAVKPDNKGEIQLTNALKLALEDGKKFYGINLSDYIRYDAGTPAAWLETMSALMHKHHD